MSQPFRIHVPIAFAQPTWVSAVLAGQEPKTTSDTPSTASGGGQAPAPGTATPGGADPARPPQGQCSNEPMLWLMPLFLLLMYFMVMRPEQKRRKEQQALLASIKQGDRVVTLSGMHGVIARLTETTVTLRVDTVEITFDRSAIARIERGDAKAPAKA